MSKVLRIISSHSHFTPRLPCPFEFSISLYHLTEMNSLGKAFGYRARNERPKKRKRCGALGYRLDGTSLIPVEHSVGHTSNSRNEGSRHCPRASSSCSKSQH